VQPVNRAGTQQAASADLPFSTEILPFSVSNQPAIFEAISNPDQLTSLLQSSNSLVTKYIAKSIAYLSLRNGKLYGIDRIVEIF
jgi:hypothetical protein